MGETDKIFEQLNIELAEAKKRVAELEAAAATSGKASSLYYSIFENFVESATDSFSMWDSNLNLIYINKATLKYHPAGTMKSDVIGKNIKELIPNVEKSGRYEKYKRVLETGESLTIEDFKADPKYGDTYLSIKVFKINDGIGIVSSDVTEHKRMEQELQDGRQRLAALIDNAPDTIFSYDGDGRFISVNRHGEEYLGYSKAEVIGKTFGELTLFTPESLAKAQQRVEDYKQGHLSEATPYELIAKDGSHVFVEVRGFPIVQDEKVEVIAIARDITERKKMEASLRQSEEKLTAIFESIGDSVTVIDVNGNITDVNNAAVKLFGCKNKEQAIGMNSLTFIAEEDQPSASNKLNQGKAERFVRYKFKRIDGSTFWGEASSDIIYDSTGNISGFVGIVRDITERRKMEEALTRSEQKLRAIFESIGDGVSIINMEGKVTEVNETALRKSGYSREEFLSKNGLELIAEKDRNRAREEMYKAFETGFTPPMEFAMLRKDGSEYPGEATSAILRDPSGNPAGLVSVLRDITERRKTEEALRDSEEKMRLIFASIPDNVSVMGIDGKMIDGNNAGVRMFGGTSLDQFIGHDGFEFMVDSEKSRAVDLIKNIFIKESGGPLEFKMRRLDGTEFCGEVIATLMRDKYGKPQSIITVIRDITDRRKAENELRQSEEKFRVIFNTIADGISLIDLTTGKLIDSNEAALHIFKFDREEVIGMNGFDLIAEKDRGRAMEDFKHTMETGDSGLGEWILLGKGGTEYLCEARSSVIFDQQHKPLYLLNVMRDISKRKELEEKLRESEEKIRQVFNSVGVGITVTDMEGKVTEINDFSFHIHGYSKAELIGQNGIKLIAERDRPRIIETMIEAFKTGQSSLQEFTSVKKDGTEYEVEAIATVLHDTSGKPTGLIISVTDITERKRIEKELKDYQDNLENMVGRRTHELSDAYAELKNNEQALKESEEKYRSLVEQISLGIVIMQDNRIVFANKAMTQINGFSIEEMLAMTPEQVVNIGHQNSRNRLAQRIDERMKGITLPEHSEWKIVRKDGTESWLDAHAIRIVFNGKPAILAIHTDITERKRMENALRNSEEKLRTMFTSMADGVIVTDLEGNVRDVNTAALNIFGYHSKEDVRDASGFEFIADSDREIAMKDMAQLFDQGIVTGRSWRFKHSSGKEFQAELSTALLRDDGGYPTEILVVMRDITERKRMEEALRESEEKLRATFEAIADGIAVADFTGKLIDMNTADIKLFGYESKEQLINRDVLDFVTEADRARVINDITSVIASGQGVAGEYRLVDRNGKEFYAEVRGSVLLNSRGEPIAIVNVIRNVTERKRVEEALRKSEEKLRIMFTSMADGVAVIGLDGKVTEINDALLRLFEHNRKEDVLGKDGFKSFAASESRDAALNDMSYLLNERRPEERTFRFISQKGREFIAEIHTSLLSDSSGNPTDIMCVVRDITERTAMEKALRESEEWHRALVETSGRAGVGIAIIQNLENRNAAIVHVNDVTCQLAGYPREKLLKMSVQDLIPPDALGQILMNYKERQQGGDIPHSYETVFMTKNKTRVPVIVSVAVMQYQGQPATVAYYRDISERKHMEEALRESEEKLRAIYDSIGDGITVTDLKGKVIDLNAACIRLAGFASKKDAIGINGLSFIAQVDRDRARNDMFNVLQKGIGITTEYKLVSRSGKEFDAEVSGAIITDGEGKPNAIVNVIRDITDRKQIEEALKESEAKYRSLVEQSEQGICILQDGKVVFANNALARMSGYTLKEMYSMPPGKMVKAIDPKFRTTYAKRLKGRLQGDKMSPRHEYRIVQKDGMERDIETYTKRIMYKGAPAVQAAIVDITERKEWEEKLNKSKEELRFYLNQITQAQEEERKRIARELHDDTVQELIALSRQIDDMVDKKITPEEDRRDSREKLEMAKQRVSAILQSVRAFTRDLRPSILDDLGLIPALEWLTSDMSGKFGIPVNISILGSEKSISPDAALAMFHIAQESLSNAGKHSKASQVQVNLKYTSKNVTLSVIDDGVGFTPPKHMSNLTKRGKLGIAGMYERAQLIGAALSVKSKRGSGTSVVLELPI